MKKNIKESAIHMIIALMIANGTQAQTPSANGAITDNSLANPTVVFRAVNTTDMEVLNAMNQSFTTGDVIRIAVAPPAPAPTATLSRPDMVVTPANTTTTAAMRKPVVTNPVANAPVTPKPTAVANVVKPAQPLTSAPAKPVVTPKVAPSPQVKPQVQQQVMTTPQVQVQQTTAPKITKTTTANTAKKSTVRKQKKSNKGISLFQPRYKNKKHGKQRYSCPKF
jgi:hypothetical protein